MRYTWQIWVSRRPRQLIVVEVDHVADKQVPQLATGRPLAIFPLPIVQEAIAQIVAKSGKRWP